MEFDYPLNMTRKAALVRRADKIIGWLQSDRYAYVSKSSVTHLKKLITILIDVLDSVLSTEDGREFLSMFQDARKMLVVEEGESIRDAYNETVTYLIGIMERYRGFVEDTEE